MSEDHEIYSDLLNRLEEQKNAIVENLHEAYTNYSNNPANERDKDNFQDIYNTKEAKFARAIEHLVLEDYDPLVFDESKNFLECVSVLHQETSETEKLIAYKNARIEKMTTDIEFYKNNLSGLKEAMDEFESKERTPRQSSKEKQMARAKSKFTELKKNMNHVLEALYPEQCNEIAHLMFTICERHFSEDGSKYAELDKDVDLNVLEILITAKIIAPHPHQSRMFKLTL